MNYDRVKCITFDREAQETMKPTGICVKINIYNLITGHVEEVLYYRYNVPMAIVEKWRWYFEYLAARVKVANPRRKA